MTIWLNNPFDNLPEEGARPQRYAMLSSELAHRGHTVVWWTSDFSHVLKRKRDAATLAGAASATLLPAIPCGRDEVRGWRNADGVQVLLVPTLPYPRNVCLARIRSHARYASSWKKAAIDGVKSGMLRKPDLVVTSLPPLETASVARRFRDLWGCRLAVDVQDAWPAVFEQLLPLSEGAAHALGSLLLCREWRLARRAFEGANGVMSVGKAYIDWARQNGAEGRPTIAGYLGIHVAPLTEDAANPRRSDAGGGNNGGMNALRLAYIGNMGRSYDLATVVEAVKSLVAEGARVTLDMAGAGPDEQSLRAAAAGCDAIRFHGQLGADALSALLARCDAGLIPMFDRSLVVVPNKLADYAAAGLAIIDTLSGETRSLVTTHGAGVWYQARDTAACRRAILSLARNPGKLAACRAASRRMAEELFDAAKIYPALCDWLEWLAR